MKTLFTKFAKKPVAVILAVLMVVGSISVAVYAADDEPQLTCTVNFKTQFSISKTGELGSYEDVDTGSGLVGYASPGDFVKADIFMETDQQTGNMGLYFYFDKNVFENDFSKSGTPVNNRYNVISTVFGGKYRPMWEVLNSATYAVVAAEFDAAKDDGVYAQGLTVINSGDGEESGYHVFSYDDGPVLTFYLKVKGNVPADAFSGFQVKRDVIQSFGGFEGGNSDIGFFNPDPDADEQYLTSDMCAITGTNITEELHFGGNINFNTVSDEYGTIGTGTTATVSGYFGNTLQSDDIPAVTPASSQYQLLGWSTAKKDGDQTDSDGNPVYGGDYSKMVIDCSDLQDEYADITYKTADPDTLYAVYGIADVSYEVRVYVQKLDDNGQPTNDYEAYNVSAPTQDDPDNETNVHTATGKFGATVTEADADSSWLPPSTGFTLNANKGKVSAELAGNADQDYLDLYYDRNAYTITWKIGDEVIDTAAIYYGADASKYADPDPVAYTDIDDPNFGYKIDENAWTEHDDPCTGNITVEGALVPLDVNVVYHNTDPDLPTKPGSFASGNSSFTVAKKYSDNIASTDFTDELTPYTGYHPVSNAKATYIDADDNSTDVADLGALPAITKDNYNCNNITAEDTIVIDIYPNFEIDTGKITFYGNGGLIGGSNEYEEEYEYGQTVIVPAESDITPKSETDGSGVESYYTFVGWGETSDATTAVTPDSTFKSTKEYYAIWEDNRIKVSFVGPDGNDLFEKPFMRNLTDGKYILTEADFAPANNAITPQTGMHWYWDKAPGDDTNVDISIPGYYKYDLVYSVKDKNGNVTTTDPTELKEGEAIPAHAVDNETGYEFMGWYTDSSYESLFAQYGTEASKTMPDGALTLYGKYEPIGYSVTYMVDGEQDGEAETYHYGDTITLRTEPTKTGYTFSGWNDVPAENKMPANDVTISGTFTANDYTIVYMNGDDIVKVITKAYDTAIDPAEEPNGSALDTDEQQFDKWSDTLPERMPVYEEDVTGNENGSEVTYHFAKRIDAQFKAKSYILSYMVDGEKYGNDEELEVGATITPREAPTKEGYTFSGWSQFPEENKMPAYNVTIEGTFTPNTYNIVYTVDGEVVKVITQDYGTSIAASEQPQDPVDTPERSFTGWSQSLPETMPVCTDTVAGYENALEIKALFSDNEQVTVTYVHADGSENKLTGYPGADLTPATFKDSDYEDGYDIAWEDDIDKFPGADKTINLKKTAKDVTVTINPSNGSDPTTTTVPYNRTITEPAQPTSPDGADFEGWVLPDGTEFDFSKPVNDQVDFGSGAFELRARYSVTDTYYIATGANGEEFTYEALPPYKHYTDTADETYPVPAIPEMEGFTAKGWSLDKSTVVTPDGTWSTSSREFYALYDINKYTITYIVDGTEYKKFEEVPFASEVKRPDADPEKEGYVFAGWKDADGNAPGNYESMPAKNLTFTADWVVPGADYTLTYFDREGSVYRVFTVHSGDPITDDYIPEDPTRFAYVFKGWDPEIPDVMPEENVELNAVWELDPKFVAMVVGGVVVSGAVVGTVAAGNAALITGGAIVGGIALVVGGAILAEHTHKVTYIVDGETYRVYYLVEGVKVIVPKAPTKDGADFTGWTPEVPERMPANDLVFNATWSTDTDTNNADGGDGPAPVDSEIPDTGSAAAGLSAFAVIATAAAAAYIIKRKKEDD